MMDEYQRFRFPEKRPERPQRPKKRARARHRDPCVPLFTTLVIAVVLFVALFVACRIYGQ